MARPQTYKDESTVTVNAAKARTKLQAGSERRAIINLLVERGGTMTMAAIDEHFGFTMRPRVIALIKAGWLEVKP